MLRTQYNFFSFFILKDIHMSMQHAMQYNKKYFSYVKTTSIKVKPITWRDYIRLFIAPLIIPLIIQDFLSAHIYSINKVIALHVQMFLAIFRVHSGSLSNRSMFKMAIVTYLIYSLEPSF